MTALNECGYTVWVPGGGAVLAELDCVLCPHTQHVVFKNGQTRGQRCDLIADGNIKAADDAATHERDCGFYSTTQLRDEEVAAQSSHEMGVTVGTGVGGLPNYGVVPECE